MSRKPTPRHATAQEDHIAELKDLYLSFFRELPVQKSAADFIGRSPDTIQDWQKDDPEFSAAVTRAKADWAKKNYRRVRPDNLLAHLYEDLKPPRQEVEQTGETTVTITYVNPPDSHSTDGQATPDVAEAA